MKFHSQADVAAINSKNKLSRIFYTVLYYNKYGTDFFIVVVEILFWKIDFYNAASMRIVNIGDFYVLPW